MITHFPKNQTPWAIQIEAINAIESAIKAGYTRIAVESPVASGKSATSMCVANWSKSAYVSMPRKSLQHQYRNTFDGDVRLVQGRASMPCTFGDRIKNEKIIHLLKTGGHIRTPELSKSCSTAPCMNCRTPKRTQVLQECSQSGQCPYTAMIEFACQHSVVVANNHSLFFGAQAGNLPKRKVLILDEAHQIESFLREQLKVTFTINRAITETDMIGMKTPQQFVDWFKQDAQFFTIANDRREEYLAKLEKFEAAGSGVYGKDAIVKVLVEKTKTTFEFTPAYVGGAAHTFFFDYADIVVFLSGTIGAIETFANPLGIKTSEISYTRLKSEIPAASRPVVMPRLADCDLSHKGWEINLPQAIQEIKRIMQHHKNHKGVVQAPSYRAAQQLSMMLADTGRVMTHTSENFADRLQAFYDSGEPKIFISPSIREGVDLKDDLARFQIILRPPYPPATEPYFKWLIANRRWDVYYKCATVEFGQMLGRPVRHRFDSGISYLISSTFKPFITKIWNQLPQWQKDAFVR